MDNYYCHSCNHRALDNYVIETGYDETTIKEIWHDPKKLLHGNLEGEYGNAERGIRQHSDKFEDR